MGTIKALRPSRPAAPAPGKHSPKDLGSTGSSREALISIYRRKKFVLGGRVWEVDAGKQQQRSSGDSEEQNPLEISLEISLGSSAISN